MMHPFVAVFAVMVRESIMQRTAGNSTIPPSIIPPSIRSKRDAIGGWGDIGDVSLEMLNELDLQMRRLNASISQIPAPLSQDFPSNDAGIKEWLRAWSTYRTFRWNWEKLFIAWRGWVNTHWSMASRDGTQAEDEFRGFRTQYDEFLKRFHTNYPDAQTDADPYTPPVETDRVGQALDVAKIAGIAALVIGGFFVLRELRSMAPAAAPAT